MSNNNKSLDSYFESARRHKSPVSGKNLQQLIEQSDANPSGKNTFFSKRRISTMALSSLVVAALFVVAVNTDLFMSNDEQNLLPKSQETTKSQESTEKLSANELEEKKNITNAQIAQNIKGTKSIKQISENQSDNIRGVNSIQLTAQELEELGIMYDSIFVIENYEPTIGFWEKVSDKSASFSRYSDNRHSHKNAALPLDESVKFIKLRPDLITEFDGSKRSSRISPHETIDGLDEFIPFYKSIRILDNLTFSEDHLPQKVPLSIENQINELEKMLIDYQTSSHSKDVDGKLIDTKIKELIKYFAEFSNADSLESKILKLSGINAEVKNITELTNLSDIKNITELTNSSKVKSVTELTDVMVLFSDKEVDSTMQKLIDDKAKLGINVLYTKQRYTMYKFLNENYPEFMEQLTFYKKQIDNYLKFNKMLSIEIPFKNDPKKNGLIFWYRPSQDLIDILPQRYRAALAKEFKLIENKDAICGADIKVEETYLDVWRTCSGSIENLRLFPNPVLSDFSIRFDLKESRILTYSLHDLNGMKIRDLKSNVSMKPGTISETFDISQIPKGMYLIVVSSDKNEVTLQRIIKQ